MRENGELKYLWPALLCTALLAAWQALTVHYSYGGNWTALYCTGSPQPLPPVLAAEHVYRFPGPGYDGQFFHYMAHDPFLRRNISAAIDNPKLRCRRILVPALAYLLAFGQDRYVDAAYIAVIWISVLLGAYWLGRLALPGLCFLLVPAVWISADRLVVDGVLAACCLGFVLYAHEGSKWKLYTVLAAAALARETGLLLIAAYVIYLALKPRLRAALFFATAALPAICWFWFVSAHTPPDNYHFFAPAFLLPLARRILHPIAYPFGGAVNAVAVSLDFLALGGFVAAVIWILRRIWRRPWTPTILAAGLFVLLAMIISDPDVWTDPFGYSRIYTPLLLLGALEGIAIRSFAPSIALLALDPRIGLQLGPQLLNVLRGILR